jgi:peptide/nickel transport system permease protein
MHLLIKKLSYLLGMMLLISIISFLAINLAPNSFIASGELNPNITQEYVEQLRKTYGLDKPMIEQYFAWVKSIAELNFGISFSSGQEVKDEILNRLPITLTLNIISMFLIFFISFYLGIKSALSYATKTDKSIKQFSLVSFSFPSFYLAILLIIIFSLYLEWFPISGLHSITAPKDGLYYYTDMAWHMFLPIFVMVFGGVGSLTIYVRSLTIEILKSDYIFFAKSRGLSSKIILTRYILPNLSPPTITMLGLSLPGLIGGSVILESIFSINGMGLLFFQSALSRDYPVIMGILIIGAFLTLLGNMIADLILIKLNPYTKG